MKMSDFRIGGKYRLPSSRAVRYVYVDGHGDFIFHEGTPFKASLTDVQRDDWQEYKESVDYGNLYNPKLMLIFHPSIPYYSWIEGYQSSSNPDKVTVVGLDGSTVDIDKKYISKVIDLPTKEL